MGTRTVTGIIYHLDGTAWAAGEIKFTLMEAFETSTETYPRETHTETLDANGQFSIALGVPDSGTAHYQVELPDKKAYEFFIAAGAATTLETILTIAGSPVDQDAVQTLIDAHEIYNIYHLYNVKAYGAIGDGINNDTWAIQAAINTCNIAGGGIVYFPRGTYVCNTLIWYKIVSLQGEGMDISIIQSAAAESLLKYTCTLWANAPCGSFIRDLMLDGNNIGTKGVDFLGIYAFTFEHIWVRRFDYGFYIIASCINQMIQCQVTECEIGFYGNHGTIGTGGDAFDVDMNLWKFLSCSFMQNSIWGVKFLNGDQVEFDGCNWDRDGTDGVADSGCVYYTDALNYIGVTFRNCWMEMNDGGAVIDLTGSHCRNQIQNCFFGWNDNSYCISASNTDIISIENSDFVMTGAIYDLKDAGAGTKWFIKNSTVSDSGPIGQVFWGPSSSLRYDYYWAQAFRPPCMTTASRDALPDPWKGMIIYNTTTDALNIYNGAWVELAIV